MSLPVLFHIYYLRFYGISPVMLVNTPTGKYPRQLKQLRSEFSHALLQPWKRMASGLGAA